MPCNKPRVIVAGFLLSVLASSTLHALPALPQARHQGRTESTGIVAAAWEWLSALFAARPTTPQEPPANRSGQQKEGSQLDPNGGD